MSCTRPIFRPILLRSIPKPLSHSYLRNLSMAMPLSERKVRRFAPLGNVVSGKGNAPRLGGVVFDVDGTLCEPQNYMFATMRAAVGIPRTSDILDFIYALPTLEEQEAAMEKIRNIEREAMISQKPQPGVLRLMEYLERKQIPKAICTRNFDAPVNHLLEKFLTGQKFHPIITREFRPPKPDPAGILHIGKEFGLEDGGQSLIMVGDSIDDMTAGYRAGAATVLLVNSVNAHLATHEHTDLCISQLDELIDILESGFVGRTAACVEESDTNTRAEWVLSDGKGEINGNARNKKEDVK